jgi:hypothetical protein
MNKFGRNDNNQSDDETDGHFEIPRGVLKKGFGWKGDELELDRDRTTLIDQNTPVAVDLKQFHNVGIGIGYQAKHVIRQPNTKSTAQQGSDPIWIGTVPTSTTISKEIKDDVFHTKKWKLSIKLNKNSERVVLPRSAKYLNCEAFRIFRKEIEKIVET